MKENNNLFIMSHQSSVETDDKIPSHPLDSKKSHSSKDVNLETKQDDPPFLNTQKVQNHDDKDKDATQNPPLLCNKEKMALLQELVPVPAMDDVEAKELTTMDEALEEESERDRLKRHRVEVAGRVWIPEIWGQEDLLKDWIDCTAFDAPLVPSKITMARAALVQEGTKTNAAPLSIDNRDLGFDVDTDLSLNNNCTNVDAQNTQVFRRQEEQQTKRSDSTPQIYEQNEKE